MRKLAIDYGKKRIGLSVSDSSLKIALLLDIYFSKGMREDVEYIKNLAIEKNVDTIILGLPLNMDGTEGKRVILTRKFGDVLKKATGLTVEYFDERLTSLEAEEIVGISYGRENSKTGEIDKIAAMLILQAYLDRNNRR